jgi:diaminopimelate decarboxylase
MTHEPVLVGGLTAEELAASFGTPLYAYDAAVIRQRRWMLTDPFEVSPRVFYGVKSNPVIGIVRLLIESGVGVDACSPGDLAVARRAGVPAEHISYIGTSVSEDDLAQVVESGAFYTADSVDQVSAYLAHRQARRQLGVRIAVGVEAGFHSHVRAGAWNSKFGIQPNELSRAVELATAAGGEIVGLHAHVGSDILDPAPHLQVLDQLLALARSVPSVVSVNVGGGWGTPFLPDDVEYPIQRFARSAEERLACFARSTGRTVELRMEPGAYFVMDSGVLITRVTGIKPAVATEDGATSAFVGVDSSYNHVVSAVIYDTYHPIELARRRGIEPPDGAKCSVVGNLMQAGDVLARDRRLPADIRAGDVLVVHKCGGYTSSRSTVFNGRPRPAEVLVDGDQVRLVRRRETVEDLLVRDL